MRNDDWNNTEALNTRQKTAAAFNKAGGLAQRLTVIQAKPVAMNKTEALNVRQKTAAACNKTRGFDLRPEFIEDAML